jgi:hypothetical protein
MTEKLKENGANYIIMGFIMNLCYKQLINEYRICDSSTNREIKMHTNILLKNLNRRHSLGRSKRR